MVYLKCDIEHLPEIIQGQLAINPHSAVKVKFNNGKFRTSQKSPEGGKFISKVVEKRSEYAGQRLQQKYYQRILTHVPLKVTK